MRKPLLQYPCDGDRTVRTVPPQHESVERFDHVWAGWAESVPKERRVAEHRHGRDRFLRSLEMRLSEAPTPQVLEVGCGSAIDLSLLSQRVTRAFPVALDISTTALGAARAFAHHLGVPAILCRGDVLALPFRNASFGLVFSQGVLEHFRNPASAFVEQVRVLTPGGYLVASVPQTFTAYTIHKRRAIRRGTWPWGWEREFTAGELSALGRRHGLDLVELFGCQYWVSWWEPAWLLRDLWGKFHRRNPLAARPPFPRLHDAFERAWTALESRFGHRFLLNVVAVFRKPRNLE